MLIIDSNKIHIEHYNKLRHLSDKEIIIEYPKYHLWINGKNLKLTYYRKDELFISGQIIKVEYHYL